MSYGVELSRQARRAFLDMGSRDRRRVGRRLRELAENPRPPGAKALAGELKGHYRLRTGDQRIVYTVQDELQLVRVVRIGPRHSVYDDTGRGA